MTSANISPLARPFVAVLSVVILLGMPGLSSTKAGTLASPNRRRIRDEVSPAKPLYSAFFLFR